MHQIVYSSKNQIAGSPEQVEAEIASILEASRRNNPGKGVTGALMFNGLIFAQVLEGPLDAIEGIYEQIQCDPRHSDVVMLSNFETASRAFEDWSMAYADLDKVRSAPELVIDFDAVNVDEQQAGPRIVDMLRALVVRESE